MTRRQDASRFRHTVITENRPNNASNLRWPTANTDAPVGAPC